MKLKKNPKPNKANWFGYFLPFCMSINSMYMYTVVVFYE